jgi:hypothetical protein
MCSDYASAETSQKYARNILMQCRFHCLAPKSAKNPLPLLRQYESAALDRRVET